MAFCVLMHRSDSIYDDLPAERYQFPKQYLGRLQASVGDWIIYLEPRKAIESRGYFAIARILRIEIDPKAPGMYRAIVDPGTYLDFAQPVPFSEGGVPLERGLLNGEGKLSGRAQSAVRSISREDFYRIVERGLDDQHTLLPRIDAEESAWGFSESQALYLQEQPRIRVEQLTTRALRDRVFRRVVLKAYDERCAISGLKLINGGGRAEVDAAHIRPVEADGPDVVNNGLALSGTAHWLFDRGLISLSDELEIMISRHVNDFDGVRGFINKTGYASPPQRRSERPHPKFLEWHRSNCFKH